MPRSRNRARTTAARNATRRRWDWRRVAGGIAEFLRNLALIAVGTPFIEPLLNGADIDISRAAIGSGIGLIVFSFALILDHERSD